MLSKSSTCHGDLAFVSPGRTMRFTGPERVLTCNHPGQVAACLEAVDDAVARGYYVAGALSYEAGWAFMDRQPPGHTSEAPLLWFGVYRDASIDHALPTAATDTSFPVHWEPGITREQYAHGIRAIRTYIEAGDAYQVNFTFPLYASFKGDPAAWFAALYAAQPTNHAAYADLGRFKILSLSPELFFEVDGDRVVTRPMKGTARRGLRPETDARARERLLNSEKDRAENLMIVDLLRNDLGRISETGAVEVESLFDVERYATVWQMTSTIAARTKAAPGQLLAALFPCGSVTGAPKLRAMEIIRELEFHPRGFYCGAIGWWGPGRRASFNVAIRTITVDADRGRAAYPVGGGITWGSTTRDEYAECMAKAVHVSRPRPAFDLLESLLFDGEYFLLGEHLERLCASAAYFAIPLHRGEVEAALLEAVRGLDAGPRKVRLRINQQGGHRIEVLPVPPVRAMRIALAAAPVDRDSPFLYHKTTHREPYEAALAGRPGFDDVVLWNDAGELTETTCANLVVDVGGARLTPPVACGLLPGVMRGELLRQGLVREAVIPLSLLPEIEAWTLVNSVRKKIPAHLCGDVCPE